MNYELLIMVGYDPKLVRLTPSEQAIIAASTSVLSRFFIQPFDVVKIRFQVDNIKFLIFILNLIIL